MRRLLVEASNGICKGVIDYKFKELRSRQKGQSAVVIAYADRAITRLRSKYYIMIRHGKKRCSLSCCTRTCLLCIGNDDGKHLARFHSECISSGCLSRVNIPLMRPLTAARH